MERLTLLRYFAQYMDENLTEGGDSQQQQDQTSASSSPAHRRRPFVHMKRWVRTPKAIIMQLDNNTLQVYIIILLLSTRYYNYITVHRLTSSKIIRKSFCRPTIRRRRRPTIGWRTSTAIDWVPPTGWWTYHNTGANRRCANGSSSRSPYCANSPNSTTAATTLKSDDLSLI